MTAKWNYLSHAEEPWSEDFLAAVGLEDVRERGSLPQTTLPVGQAVGRLAAGAAEDLGLDTDCVVASGLIDAYAGAFGVLGPFAGAPDALVTPGAGGPPAGSPRAATSPLLQNLNDEQLAAVTLPAS